MTPSIGFAPPCSGIEHREMIPIDSDIVELALLLPRWQAVALESIAQDLGITAGQMLRRMIGENLQSNSAAR